MILEIKNSDFNVRMHQTDQQKYNLRSKSNVNSVPSTSKNIPQNKAAVNPVVPSKNKPVTKPVSQEITRKNNQQTVKIRNDEGVSAERSSTGFSLENEINKVKLQIPLVELMKNQQYKEPILKIL